MQIDPFGTVYFTEKEVCDLLYENPALNLKDFLLENPALFNSSNKKLHAGLDAIKPYTTSDQSVAEFDQARQQTWFIPQSYADLDIEDWLLSQCQTEQQIQRVELEIELFEQTNLVMLVKYLKYLVDTMTKKDIVWGVGRGSSTASYVLYLIGLHMIDPIKYNIPIDEFFKKDQEHVENL